MSVSLAALWGGATLGAGDTVLYTAPTGTVTSVSSAIFNNIDAVNRTFSLRVVRSGGSPDVFLINTQALAPTKRYVSPEVVNLVLRAGDMIVGSANAAGVIQTVGSGYEVVG